MMNDNLFDEFWSLYPRKVNKHYARECWKKKAVNEEKAREIIKTITSQLKNGYFPKDEKFVPHASTYINQHRFEDKMEDKQDVTNCDHKTETIPSVEHIIANEEMTAHFQETISGIQEDISPISYDVWIKPILVMDVTSTGAFMLHHDTWKWVKEHYQELLEKYAGCKVVWFGEMSATSKPMDVKPIILNLFRETK